MTGDFVGLLALFVGVPRSWLSSPNMADISDDFPEPTGPTIIYNFEVKIDKSISGEKEERSEESSPHDNRYTYSAE